MDWLDIVTIISFVLSILSFLIGVVSLVVSIWSLWRTGKIRQALEEQAEHKFQRDNARNLRSQVEALLDQVQKDYEDLAQVERDIKQSQFVLSKLQYSVDVSKTHVEKILKMINENTANGYNGESLSHTSQDYIDALSALVMALIKEAD